jgi:hypothetical protein
MVVGDAGDGHDDAVQDEQGADDAPQVEDAGGGRGLLFQLGDFPLDVVLGVVGVPGVLGHGLSILP